MRYWLTEQKANWGRAADHRWTSDELSCRTDQLNISKKDKFLIESFSAFLQKWIAHRPSISSPVFYSVWSPWVGLGAQIRCQSNSKRVRMQPKQEGGNSSGRSSGQPLRTVLEKRALAFPSRARGNEGIDKVWSRTRSRGNQLIVGIQL